MEGYDELIIIRARAAMQTHLEGTWAIGTQIDLTGRTTEEKEERICMTNFERLRYSDEHQTLLWITALDN